VQLLKGLYSLTLRVLFAGAFKLACELDNVSKACRIMGYSREQFYEIRRNFQTFGADGLLDKIRGAKIPHPNRICEELGKAVLDHCLQFPTQGSLRVSQQLVLKNIHVGVGAVGGIWHRHNMITKHQRLLRLEKHYKENNIPRACRAHNFFCVKREIIITEPCPRK